MSDTAETAETKIRDFNFPDRSSKGIGIAAGAGLTISFPTDTTSSTRSFRLVVDDPAESLLQLKPHRLYLNYNHDFQFEGQDNQTHPIFLLPESAEDWIRWVDYRSEDEEEPSPLSSLQAGTQAVTIDAQACLDVVEVEELEDGMTLELGERIEYLAKTHGVAGITALSIILSSGSMSPETVSHTLRWIGRINGPKTLDARVKLLTTSLESQSPIIRDGAALGLGVLGSQQAIPSIQKAIEQEKIKELKKDMRRVLEKLQS